MKSYKYGAYRIEVYTTKSRYYLAVVVYERKEVYTTVNTTFDEALQRARVWVREQGGSA